MRKSLENLVPSPSYNLVEGYGTALLPLDVVGFVSGNVRRTVSLLFYPSRATMSLNYIFLLFVRMFVSRWIAGLALKTFNWEHTRYDLRRTRHLYHFWSKRVEMDRHPPNTEAAAVSKPLLPITRL